MIPIHSSFSCSGRLVSVVGLRPGARRAILRPNRLSSPETNSGAPSGRPVASARRSSVKSSSVSTLSSSFRCGIQSSAGRTLTSPSSAPYVNFRLPRLSGQQVQIDFVIAVLKKDRLAPVATLGNMMRKPRNHNSSQASQAGTIAPRAGNRYHHVPLFPQSLVCGQARITHLIPLGPRS